MNLEVNATMQCTQTTLVSSELPSDATAVLSQQWDHWYMMH